MKHQVENILDTEIPRWEKPTLPEEADVIMIAKQFVEKYGCNMWAWYRLSLDQLGGGGSVRGNSISINGNGFNRDIRPSEVVPGYINISSPNDIRVANAQNPSTFAKFLILGNDTNNTGFFHVQGSGIYEFPSAHGYIVGQDYYLGEDGFPTTAVNVNPDKVQKLFYVLSQRAIDIKVA